MSAFTILLGGDMVPTRRLARQVAGTRVIAADSGIRHAGLLALRPELWVGDFDSTEDDLAERYPDLLRQTFPTRKNRTDGEIAVDAALERDATSLILCGAFGGERADHAFLHLTLAMRLREQGIRVILSSGFEEGWPLMAGERTHPSPPLPDGCPFSILAFSDLEHLDIRGAEWELERADVPFGSSLTLSNASRGGLDVGLGRGRALLLARIGAT